MKKDGEFHLQIYATSPAPKRDYHGLTITNKFVILNSWDISRGPHVYPRRRRLPLENFSEDKSFCSDIKHLFGEHVLHYVHRVATEDASLYSLPEKVFRKVLGYLAVGDILRLGQSSKIFFQMCNSNEVWKMIFRKKFRRSPTKAELDKSEVMSWRHIMYRRIYEELENQKISAKFKHGVDTLNKQNKKEAEKIKQNNNTPYKDIYRREPPQDKYKNKKLPINTYRLESVSEIHLGNFGDIKDRLGNRVGRNSAKLNGKNETKDTKTNDKSKKSDVRKIGGNKIDNDLKTKSTTRLISTDKNLKLTKSNKDLNNLKSKSVFL